MANCDLCGKDENMPYRCRYCGGTFCADHRLPENHSCPGLEDWGDPGGVFDSGFDADPDGSRRDDRGLLGRIGLGDRVNRPGGPLSYFRNNVSYVFLAVIWMVFLAEIIVINTLGSGPFQDLFVLRSTRIEYVWTWVTSVFSHSPAGLFHIAGNSIVLYFFGPVLERRIGSKKFVALFLVAGVAAGLAQVVAGLVVGNPTGVLGASGAIMAILGVITVLNPNLRVYLYFIFPIPLWVLTFGYAALSIFGVVSTANVMGNVAHLAHLSGLLVGLGYGEKLKREGKRGLDQLRLGGGRGPGGRRRRW